MLNKTRSICMNFYSNAAVFSHKRDDIGFRNENVRAKCSTKQSKGYRVQL